MNASPRIEIARILCPIDTTEFSEHALRHAAAIARWYGAELRALFVHVMAPAIDVLPPLAGPPPMLTLTPERRREILDHLQRFCAGATGGYAVDLRVEDAPNVAREILAQAGVWPADLVVLGSHGRSGFQKFLLGSVADKVLRLAPCPVLVVPRRVDRAPTPGDPTFDRILCSIDFSASSLRALEYAMTMAEEADAELTVMNAIEMPPELRETPLSADFSVEAVRAHAEAAQQRRLLELIPESVRTFCKIETAVVEGRASREILRLAAAKQADLIVMGVQGRGALDLAIFGSNAQQVTKESSCPVLVVRGSV